MQIVSQVQKIIGLQRLSEVRGLYSSFGELQKYYNDQKGSRRNGLLTLLSEEDNERSNQRKLEVHDKFGASIPRKYKILTEIYSYAGMIIPESDSYWTSCGFIKKPHENGWRFVVYLRKLNDQVQTASQALPSVEMQVTERKFFLWTI